VNKKLLTTLSDAQLLDQWKAIVSGMECGCPLCIRDLLDELAPRFGKKVEPAPPLK
jgi:hypothetical protein